MGFTVLLHYYPGDAIAKAVCGGSLIQMLRKKSAWRCCASIFRCTTHNYTLAHLLQGGVLLLHLLLHLLHLLLHLLLLLLLLHLHLPRLHPRFFRLLVTEVVQSL
jgi:hypothetical protein